MNRNNHVLPESTIKAAQNDEHSVTNATTITTTTKPKPKVTYYNALTVRKSGHLGHASTPFPDKEHYNAHPLPSEQRYGQIHMHVE